MSHVDVNAIINTLSNCSNNRNGREFASIVGIRKNCLNYKFRDDNIASQLESNIRRMNLQSICNSRFRDSNLASSICSHITTLLSIYKGNFVQAYRDMLVTYNTSLDYFSNKDEDDTSWYIPVIIKLSNDLRIIASLADMSQSDAENTLLRDSIQSLTRGWTTVAKDRTPITNPTSKKLALFAVTNVLFKIYFSLNTLSLCGKLINVLEGPSSGGVMDNLHLFAVCDVVMYKYYNGRLKMYEDKYEDAREYLRFALKYTPISKECFQNRQRIMASLVPVEMCLGVMPSTLIQTKYGLTELVLLGQSAMKGDIKTFEYILTTYQISFIKIGIYLVLEQMKHIVYRSLCKRIYHLLDNNTRINLLCIENAMRWMGQNNISLDEIECILSNLIYQGQIKGYISHQKRFLVVSKADPFPTSAVIKKYTSS